MVVDLASNFRTKKSFGCLIFLICALIATGVVFAHSSQTSLRIENPTWRFYNSIYGKNITGEFYQNVSFTYYNAIYLTQNKTELVMLSLSTLFPQVYSIKKYGNDFLVSNSVSSVVVQPYYEVERPTTQLTFPPTQFSRSVNHSIGVEWAFLNATFSRNVSGSIQIQTWTFQYNVSYLSGSGSESVVLTLKPFPPLTVKRINEYTFVVTNQFGVTFQVEKYS